MLLTMFSNCLCVCVSAPRRVWLCVSMRVCVYVIYSELGLSCLFLCKYIE